MIGLYIILGLGALFWTIELVWLVVLIILDNASSEK